MKLFGFAATVALAALGLGWSAPPDPPPLPPVLAEIDKSVREDFFDPKLKGVDWSAAVRKAADELSRAASPAEQGAVYDRLLATLDDSHTFRLPAGKLPDRNWGTAGLRIGRDGDGYAVKGLIPGSSAATAGMKIGDRILEVDGVPYGKARVNFRDLFLVFEGVPGSAVVVTWKPGSEPERTSRLGLRVEEPGDTMVWRSARVIRRDSKAFGYVHLWGMSAETALAIVDLLLDRDAIARVRPQLAGWNQIDGLLLDDRGNSGGYDPNILPSFLRGLWSSGDYFMISRSGKRLVPPPYKPLPVVLLVNSGTASAGESLALKFRAHAIGQIVGEVTAGMASGGASASPLSDGSMLWLSRQAIESLDGKSYEGRGIEPDVAVADRPAPGDGEEDAIVEAGLKALGGPKAEAGRR
ncbi:MAG: S41 family peptidase [Acidobacteriota bacterium]